MYEIVLLVVFELVRNDFANNVIIQRCKRSLIVIVMNVLDLCFSPRK